MPAYEVGSFSPPAPIVAAQLRGPTGTNRYRFRGRFLLADIEYGILDRNILNRLVLTLDRPRLFWSA